MTIVYSRRARQELRELVAWSDQHMGEATTDRYLTGYSMALRYLQSQPQAGRLVHDGDSVRRYRYKSHSIFYRMSSAGLYITRILHAKRSADAIEFPEV